MNITGCFVNCRVVASKFEKGDCMWFYEFGVVVRRLEGNSTWSKQRETLPHTEPWRNWRSSRGGIDRNLEIDTVYVQRGIPVSESAESIDLQESWCGSE